MLWSWLRFARATVTAKATGLSPAQLRERLVRSETTMGGILKHLVTSEQHWFGNVLGGQNIPMPFHAGDPDGDWRVAEGEDSGSLVRAYGDACAASDQNIEALGLGSIGAQRDGTLRFGEAPFSGIVDASTAETLRGAAATESLSSTTCSADRTDRCGQQSAHPDHRVASIEPFRAGANGVDDAGQIPPDTVAAGIVHQLPASPISPMTPATTRAAVITCKRNHPSVRRHLRPARRGPGRPVPELNNEQRLHRRALELPHRRDHTHHQRPADEHDTDQRHCPRRGPRARCQGKHGEADDAQGPCQRRADPRTLLASRTGPPAAEPTASAAYFSPTTPCHRSRDQRRSRVAVGRQGIPAQLRRRFQQLTVTAPSSGPESSSGAYAMTAARPCKSPRLGGESLGRGPPSMRIPSEKLTATQVHGSVNTTVPRAAGTTAASVGTLRPPSTGIHRGNTSPHVETSPTAVNASSSETMDSTLTYSPSGTPGTPDGAEPALGSPRPIGTWNVHTAIRLKLAGRRFRKRPSMSYALTNGDRLKPKPRPAQLSVATDSRHQPGHHATMPGAAGHPGLRCQSVSILLSQLIASG
jgi:hypothetical protein